MMETDTTIPFVVQQFIPLSLEEWMRYRQDRSPERLYPVSGGGT
jgi:hypothetical protein